MKCLAIALLAACSGPAKKPAQDPRDFPIEAAPQDAAAPDETEELPFVPVGGVGEELPAKEPLKITGSPASTIAASGCIPAGAYSVKVDLSSAKLSQVNTGMDDIAWCKSLLEGIPATTMATLAVIVEGGQMRVEWPPGKPQTIVSIGSCSIAITSPPMIAQMTFGKNGKATGATSYSIGTQNHPDESCSAVGAKLALQKQ